MEKQYFVILEGIQSGPFTIEALRTPQLTPETYIWREGLTDWVKAGTLPELSELFNQTPPPYGQQPQYGQPQQPGYGRQPYYGQQSYGAPHNPYGSQGFNPGPMGEPVPHTNWMPWAIVATVVGVLFNCIGFIFGIIGITNASKANRFYDIGDKSRGDQANSMARTMTIIALALCALSIVLLVTGVTGGYLDNLRDAMSALDNLN